MQDTSKDTKKKINDGRAANGGARPGSGRKKLNKKYGSYFLPESMVDQISTMKDPSKFVEKALNEALKKLDKM